MDYPNLTFEQPDKETFRNLALAFKALEKAGNAPCILNAANEVAVDSFLEHRIGFLDIVKIVRKTLDSLLFDDPSTIADVTKIDKEARKVAEDLVKSVTSAI